MTDRHLVIATQMIAHYNAQDADAFVSLMTADASLPSSPSGEGPGVGAVGKHRASRIAPTPTPPLKRRGLSVPPQCSAVPDLFAVMAVLKILPELVSGRGTARRVVEGAALQAPLRGGPSVTRFARATSPRQARRGFKMDSHNG